MLQESNSMALKSKFQVALAISRLDKEQKKNNQVDLGLKHDYHEIVVTDNNKSSKLFVVGDANHPNVETEIDQSITLHSERDGQHSQMISTVVLKGSSPPEITLKSMRGNLMKKSPHMLQGWQDRYVELDNKVLKYFIPDQKTKPFGTLNFDLVTYTLQEIKDSKGKLIEFMYKQQFIPMNIQPHSSQKVFNFRGANTEETQAWVHAVRTHLLQSKGGEKALYGICHYYRFWRTDRITEKQFEAQADTGDILLFRGNSANCLLQRTFTRSDYDHVAVVIKRLATMESAFVHGVYQSTDHIGDMIDNKWCDLYERVSYRKLNITRDQKFLKDVQDFVNANIGKKYSCAPKKLIKMKSSIPEVNKTQDVKEERTFFCSELVAAMYKACGLLPADTSASQYWPGSFSSEKKDVQLLKGTLGSELLLDFTN